MSESAATSGRITRTGILSAALLSAIAYYDEDNPTKEQADMSAALGSIQAAVNGPWSLVWGPATNSGILAYIAQGADGTHTLAIRGTINDEATGFLSDFLDDADATELAPWLYTSDANTQAAVAWGSNAGLNALAAMTDRKYDNSIVDYLRGAAAFSDITVNVVGHSLGGDLATLAAAWLYDQLPKVGSSKYTVVPYTFAAPTTGNAAFAELWNGIFGTASYAAVNMDDIVPMAWNGYGNILKTYEPQGGTDNQILKNYSYGAYLAALLPEPIIDGIGYTPVTPSQLDSFGGPNIPPDVDLFPDWPSVVRNQHSLETAYIPHVWFGWNGDFSSEPPQQ